MDDVGAGIALQAAQVLHNVRESAQKVEQSIAKIEQSSVEQAEAIEQIKLAFPR